MIPVAFQAIGGQSIPFDNKNRRMTANPNNEQSPTWSDDRQGMPPHTKLNNFLLLCICDSQIVPPVSSPHLNRLSDTLHWVGAMKH